MTRINYQPVDDLRTEINIFNFNPERSRVVQRLAVLSAPHSSSRGGKIRSRWMRWVRASTPRAHDVNNRLLINCLTAQVELTMANLWFVTPSHPRAPRVVTLANAAGQGEEWRWDRDAGCRRMRGGNTPPRYVVFASATLLALTRN